LGLFTIGHGRVNHDGQKRLLGGGVDHETLKRLKTKNQFKHMRPKGDLLARGNDLWLEGIGGCAGIVRACESRLIQGVSKTVPGVILWPFCMGWRKRGASGFDTDCARWVDAVVAGLRGVHPGLEPLFERLYARRLGFAAA
jgi:hypothetical protein